MVTATENKLIGDKTYAMGADPTDQTTYEFKFKVVPLSSLIASHDTNMQPNKDYPQELQPRLRDRAASRTQVDNIARNLNPKILLHDTGFIDTGPMIVGNDNVVESGNGRVLALQTAIESYPEKYRLYKVMLVNQADKYGLSPDDIETIKNPVLVRERVTKVDRAEFARQANVGAVMGMSPYEQANQDAKKLSAEVVSQLYVGEDQTIDQALRLKANDHIVNAFVKTVPANERATISDEKGNLNLQGINRLKLALFAKTYTGEAGQRLSRIFGESADPYVKQIENAMFQSLPDMAKAESLIATGDRDNNMSVAPDLAEIVDTYAGIKANGLTIKDYLNQSAMFEERLDPYQKALLGHFDTIARKPKLIREFIRESAQGIIDAPPKGQISMMGSDPITKESITYGVINKQRKELGEAPIVYQPATAGKRLEKPDTGGIKSTGRVGGEQKKDKGEHQMTATSTRKEFWQMTRREVGAADLPDSVVASVLKTHEQAVKQAVEQGKPVPAEVLKDYPELKKAIDIPVKSDIMTSEGKEDDNGNEVRGLGTRTEGERLREPESHERMARDVTPSPPEESQGKGKGSEATGREPDGDGSAGLRSVAEGDQGGDSGERQRLEPKDIELNEQSDIGHNAGAVTRWEANIKAIKTLKQIESEHREATPDEQKMLSRYSGFGDSAFSEAFPRSEREKRYGYDDSPWGKRRAELKEITTPEEFKSLEGSRLNAFFTTPEVINFMWQALDQMGVKDLKNPRILEPSAGSGRFLGYQPKELKDKSQRIAVELDLITGRILKHTYPQAETYVMGFERAPIPKDSIDVAISNVPFGNYPVFDPTFKKDRKRLTRSIHNYFFAKTLEDLRPGGILAFITSHETMDAPTAKPVRQALADQADLVGAIRLPKGAFPDTQVVTDIVFMRKRLPTDIQGDQSWVSTSPVKMRVKTRYGEDFDDTFNVNDYFIQHPEMVLGTPSGSGSMRPHKWNEGEYTVDPKENVPLSSQLNKTVQTMPRDIVIDAPRRELVRRVYTPTGAVVHEGTRVIGNDGSIYIKKDGALESANLTATEEAKVKAMLGIRDAAKKVIDIQVRNGTALELNTAQNELDHQYRMYVLANGPLTAPKNAELLENDPDAPFLKALENTTILRKNKRDLTEQESYMVKILTGKLPVEEKELPRIQMPIFNKRIIHGLGDKPVSTYADAESVVKNEVGRLDFALMGEKLGKTEDEVIRGLAAQKLIYHNPVTDEWEPADRYLTGDVRTKLRQAEDAATARPKEFKVNVEDLKVVQPADIPAGEIAVRMGAPWIPASDINDFVVEILNTDKYKTKRGYRHWDEPEIAKDYVKYNEVTGEWTVAGKNEFDDTTALTETYGTQKMPAHKIIEAILNGKLIEVRRGTGKYNDKGEEIKERDDTETVNAQEKAKLIQTKFQDWIWKDEERTERLASSYNDKFNNYRPRTFDGRHLELPGISEKWHNWMMSHQKDAVWRVIQDRTALLAHEVGFGKTAVMVTSGMELRRMGLSRKNLYVVPKATHGQFRDDFLDIYPTAKILFPTEEDFTPGKRAEFMSRAITGDWDAIIMSDSQFTKLPVRPETEARFLEDELDTMREAWESSDDKTTQKQIQANIKRAEERLKTLQDKIKDKSDKTVYFEDLGVDQMYVDEADAYKNLRFATHMGRVKGLPNSASIRAWDMYTKTRSLQENKHNGVVFATGTPIANTIAEMYTMMRYLQEPMLEEKGLKHFDAWAKTFGETTESLEQTPQGTYRLTQRFAKFGNAPELSNIWQMTADVRVADEVPEMVAARPRIIDEQGKQRRTVIATPADQALLDYMQELVERADKLKGKPEKGGDNMLKISSDARKASLDMRLVKANAPVNPNGKVTVACKKIADIYRETTPNKGAQLVFLDLGTPKAKEKEPEFDEDGNIINEESDETIEEAGLLKDVYRNIKAQLIADGVDEKDIAFIHDAKTQDQKRAMRAKVNSGEIRVIVGSTGKMGAGVNVQERAAALHHLDAPWRPRDIEQREGRVIRQGNKVYGPIRDENGKIIDTGKGVRIYSYVTEKSFDAFMWQAIEAKSKAIKSIMRRSVPPRSIEDVDSFTLSASEAKAIASGNPDVFKQVSLKNAVARFQMLKASHTDQIVRARSQLKQIPKQIEILNTDIARMEKDAKKVHDDAKFSINIKDKDYEARPDAGDALITAMKSAQNNDIIGEYQGFKIKVLDHGPQQGYELAAENPETGSTYLGGSSMMYADITPAGAVTRLDNIVKKIPQRVDDAKKQLKESEKNLQTYKDLAEKPFEYEKQLNQAEAELERVSRRLQGQKVEGNESDNYVPEVPEENEPVYHYSARGEEIKAKEEVEAVKAEFEPVEKDTEVKVSPAQNVVNIVDKMETPIVGTVQTGLEGMGVTSAQADMLGEFAGKLGAKPKLVDIEKLEEHEESKPLPGQIEMAAKPDLVEAVHDVNMKEQERLSKQGGTGKMKLLTKELADQFPKLYATEKIPEGDKVVIAKYFHPLSHQTWYAVEYDPQEQRFFGYVDTGDYDSEWGYFSLDEMQDLTKGGIGMERDLYFKPQKISAVLPDRGFESAPEVEPPKITYKQPPYKGPPVATVERISFEEKPKTETQPPSPREVKAIDKRLKEIRQAKDMAYDMAIYDKGASLTKLENEERELIAKKTPPVKPIETIKPVEPKVETPKVEREPVQYKEFSATYSVRDDSGETKIIYKPIVAENMATALGVARNLQKDIGGTLHAVGEKREPKPEPVKGSIAEMAEKRDQAFKERLEKLDYHEAQNAIMNRDDFTFEEKKEALTDLIIDRQPTPELKAETKKSLRKPKVQPIPIQQPATTDKTDLQKIHEARTQRAQAIDDARTNIKTITSNNPLVESWKREFGNYDVVGIDTPRHHPKPMKIRARNAPKMRSNKPPKQKTQRTISHRHGIYHVAGHMVSRHPIRIGKRR